MKSESALNKAMSSVLQFTYFLLPHEIGFCQLDPESWPYWTPGARCNRRQSLCLLVTYMQLSLGAILIGTFLNVWLYGILVTQVTLYYSVYKKLVYAVRYFDLITMADPYCAR